MGARAAKRAEARLVLVEVEEEGPPAVFDEYDLAVIGMYEDDCQHGCNGDCVEYGSDRCDFTCHPGAGQQGRRSAP
jgi:hypothetical protein